MWELLGTNAVRLCFRDGREKWKTGEEKEVQNRMKEGERDRSLCVRGVCVCVHVCVCVCALMAGRVSEGWRGLQL